MDRTSLNILHHRLHNQQIASPTFQKPEDVVGWLGAVQAQDYLGSLWAVGLRMNNATEAAIEGALAERTIIRTWPMRGTLHFVAAADVRWMLELMTPRVVAANARRLQQHYELDDAVIARSREVFIRVLQGGRQLSRTAMYQALEDADISTTGQRGLHILWQLAQQGLLCFGAREGKQQTFVLLDEWVPHAQRLKRDEALAQLARRYFTSHGPATLQDFIWWTGLSTTDALAGLEMARAHLEEEVVDGRHYWLSPVTPVGNDPSPTAHLLPAFDEYMVAYKDRTALLDPVDAKRATSRDGILNSTIVIDGQAVGTWKRTLKKGSVIITPYPFTLLKKSEEDALDLAARRYGEFLGLRVAGV